MTTTLNGLSLGIVVKESSDLRSDLEIMNMPMSPSSETQLWDMDGTKRKIRLLGVYINNSGVSALKTWKDSIEALQNGSQVVIPFVSDLLEINCMITSFKWDFVAAEVNALRYSIELVEGI